jgi:hypothetical protein
MHYDKKFLAPRFSSSTQAAETRTTSLVWWTLALFKGPRPLARPPTPLIWNKQYKLTLQHPQIKKVIFQTVQILLWCEDLFHSFVSLGHKYISSLSHVLLFLISVSASLAYIKNRYCKTKRSRTSERIPEGVWGGRHVVYTPVSLTTRRQNVLMRVRSKRYGFYIGFGIYLCRRVLLPCCFLACLCDMENRARLSICFRLGPLDAFVFVARPQFSQNIKDTSGLHLFAFCVSFCIRAWRRFDFVAPNIHHIAIHIIN